MKTSRGFFLIATICIGLVTQALAAPAKKKKKVPTAAAPINSTMLDPAPAGSAPPPQQGASLEDTKSWLSEKINTLSHYNSNSDRGAGVTCHDDVKFRVNFSGTTMHLTKDYVHRCERDSMDIGGYSCTNGYPVDLATIKADGIATSHSQVEDTFVDFVRLPLTSSILATTSGGCEPEGQTSLISIPTSSSDMAERFVKAFANCANKAKGAEPF